MGIAVDAPEVPSALALLDRADRQSGTCCLRGVVRGEVVGALAVPRSNADPLKAGEAVMDRLVSAFGTSQLLVALGNPMGLLDVDLHSPYFHSSLLLATCAYRLLGRADQVAPAR